MAVTEQSQAASRAVDDLFRRHGASVYRYAFAVLGNYADAEDVTQTTFLNAYRAIEQGVTPRKPENWLLTIASNAIKQRFRQEGSRPAQVVLDADVPGASADDDGPTIGELLTALSQIPPQQRQAIVLREFEGRSYKEISGILGVTNAALETLLFRARRSLAEELDQHLTCTEAQLAVSRAADGRLGRKERRRLREHLGQCPDCARFARLQQRGRSALRGLVVLPVPVSLAFLKGFEGTASAAVMPAGGASLAAAGVAGGGGGAATGGGLFAGGGLLAGGAATKAAAVVAAASVAGGVGVVGATEVKSGKPNRPAKAAKAAGERPGQRLGQTAPRGILVPGNGVARGKATAPGQPRATAKRPAHATRNATSGNSRAEQARQARQARQAAAERRVERSATRERTTGQAKAEPRSVDRAAERPLAKTPSPRSNQANPRSTLEPTARAKRVPPGSLRTPETPTP